MIEFATKTIDVLIATTIVESGIDNATANTLIIEDSQRLGLAQLLMQDGLLEEARQVYPFRHLNSLNTVGYKEIFKYLDGEWTLEFAIGKIKQNSRIYSRKQMTWFSFKDGACRRWRYDIVTHTLYFQFRTSETKPKMLMGITLLGIGVLAGGLMGALYKKRSPLIQMGLALLLGGAASNAYDRIIKKEVTDYFRISIGSERLDQQRDS